MQTRSFISRIFRWLRYFHAIFGALFILVAVFILTNTFIFTGYRVDGQSMEPTLKNNQLLPVCLVCTTLQTPLKDSIVIVQYVGDQNIRFVKRVLGVPGETIHYNDATLTLSADEYFVVGDNRDHSTDSRSYGPIKRSQIIGLVLGNYGEAPGPLQ